MRQGQKERSPDAGSLAGMRRIAGREFLMGSEDFYPEEAPIRRAVAGDFWIDECPVTNGQFAAFVEATGYTTFAEIAPNPKDYPGMPLEMAKAGSAVFMPTVGPVPLDNPGNWWAFVFGACWRHPLGPGSDIADIMDHPAVQISYDDALAYSKWARKDLPTEAEWEFAARGGQEQQRFGWGEEERPGGRLMANYWQGEFPWRRTGQKDFDRTSPVGVFPPNPFGLYDMIGNVWEWTSDWYSELTTEPARSCCGPARARFAPESESYDPYLPQQKIGRKVCKGGSHLCADNYCKRYRPAARHPQAIDSPTSHTGFRCVVRL